MPKLASSLEVTDLIHQETGYDANNNVVRQTAPHFGGDAVADVPVSAVGYDAMDRPTLVTGPDRTADPAGERTRYEYDVAGRVTRVTLPSGMRNGTPNNVRTVNMEYDALDRTMRRFRIHDTGSGSQVLNELLCYDPGGNLVSVTAPNAGLSALACPGTTNTPFTTVYRYDAAHRLTGITDAEDHVTSFDYDENSNRTTVTNPTATRPSTSSTS